MQGSHGSAPEASATEPGPPNSVAEASGSENNRRRRFLLCFFACFASDGQVPSLDNVCSLDEPGVVGVESQGELGHHRTQMDHPRHNGPCVIIAVLAQFPAHRGAQSTHLLTGRNATPAVMVTQDHLHRLKA